MPLPSRSPGPLGPLADRPVLAAAAERRFTRWRAAPWRARYRHEATPTSTAAVLVLHVHHERGVVVLADAPTGGLDWGELVAVAGVQVYELVLGVVIQRSRSWSRIRQ